jgi:hypothetical protein
LHTSFELWLTEAAGANSKATMVSNKLAGKLKRNAADPTAVQVQFHITPPLTSKMKGPNPKLPPQQFMLQFQWQLTSGKLNPQATYTCVAMVPGAGVQPLVTAQGLQFQPTGGFSQAMPYAGQTNFSIYIVEVVADQSPRTVSNVQNVKVR